MSNFVTHNGSAGAEVTNMNGDIYNTTIIIVDTEHLNHLASLFAEPKALDRIAAQTRFNQEPRAHAPDLQVPVAAPTLSTNRASAIKETRMMKFLRCLGACSRGIMNSHIMLSTMKETENLPTVLHSARAVTYPSGKNYARPRDLADSAGLFACFPPTVISSSIALYSTQPPGRSKFHSHHIRSWDPGFAELKNVVLALGPSVNYKEVLA
ncbi:hypothetical protein FIBSPDRAFT_935811 [Athelia psychrophila]|uniref:Uncharacterized protein n=1 Tax=Athelia psychrophila TaxID=1759441 RepID=A0A166D7J9_9AGAM|nr:hypothetical protein FIBSPDRAFT_935811 [Fibularhizoctonia sp. CBS 109695]